MTLRKLTSRRFLLYSRAAARAFLVISRATLAVSSYMILPIDKCQGGLNFVAFPGCGSGSLSIYWVMPMRIPKLVIAAFVLINLLLVAACLFSLRQNMQLRGDIADDEALLTPAKGSVVPPLTGDDWTGAPAAIIYGQDPRPTLVYTFSEHCGFCQENWRAMRRLQVLSPRQVRIVYIDTVNELFTREYLATNGIGQSSLLVDLSPRAALVYNARAVPQLLLVDHAGRVQWSHVGEIGSGDVSRLLSLIERN